jgi:AcrR family transcriptional regulator
VRAPRQSRSLRTHQRLLEAAEALLGERDWDQVSVADIVERAHSSTGAFYKHFVGKTALLPLLLQRLDAATAASLSTLLDDPRHADSGLARRVEVLLESMAAAYLQRRRLIRAFVAARFGAQLKLGARETAVARERMQALQAWLLQARPEVTHPEPEIAVRAGLYLVLQSLQTALLFEELPPELPPGRLVKEAQRMLVAYLTAPPGDGIAT